MHEVNAPIGAEEFSALMRGFAPFSKKIALAVSGGPDSMALAYCVQKWGKADCIAFIVEHGLREESATEAKEVKKRLHKLGVSAEILTWRHGEIRSRLHEVAREARYRLLIDACKKHGVKDLLMAHQAEDQAETVLMRLAKGTGIDGLAGIPPQSRRDDIRILRPLLSFSKNRLIATCKKARIQTVTDPSNAKAKYARGRLRKIMPLLDKEGLTIERLTALSNRAREAKDALDGATHDFLNKSAHIEIGGFVLLDREALRSIPRAIAMRALGACLRFVHEGEHPPDYDSLASVVDMLLGESGKTRTIHGCMISPSEKQVTILREPAAAKEEIPIGPRQTVLWDKRWLVTASAKASPGTIRALGNPPHEILDALAPGLRKQIPQGRIRASLPAIWKNGELSALPSFEKNDFFKADLSKKVLF